MRALETLVIWALVAVIGIMGLTLAYADEAQIRRQFFKDAKQAILIGGQTVNCCGEGDATRAKVIGSHGDLLAVEIIDPMRHPTAKAGEVYTVPKGKIAKWPHAPSALGTILFLSVSPLKELRRPYCLNPAAGG